MKITLLTVGKTDVKWVSDGLALYESRLSHYARFSIVEIPQLKNVSALSRDEIKLKEGELLLRNVRSGDRLVLLDERGDEFSSLKFAAKLEKMLQTGSDIIFAVGGAYGFSEAVYSRADAMVSLSRMTFSHQMVRVIFAEQIYRAFTIIRGEPYHHE